MPELWFKCLNVLSISVLSFGSFGTGTLALSRHSRRKPSAVAIRSSAYASLAVVNRCFKPMGVERGVAWCASLPASACRFEGCDDVAVFPADFLQRLNVSPTH